MFWDRLSEDTNTQVTELSYFGLFPETPRSGEVKVQGHRVLKHRAAFNPRFNESGQLISLKQGLPNWCLRLQDPHPTEVSRDAPEGKGEAEWAGLEGA